MGRAKPERLLADWRLCDGQCTRDIPFHRFNVGVDAAWVRGGKVAVGPAIVVIDPGQHEFLPESGVFATRSRRLANARLCRGT